jgi:hypothetical protein
LYRLSGRQNQHKWQMRLEPPPVVMRRRAARAGGTEAGKQGQMTMKWMIRTIAVAVAMGAGAGVLSAADETYKVTINETGFEPATLDIPADKKVMLSVTNATKKAAEFESGKLGREKVVPVGKTVTIPIGPLKAGSYEFEDDFNKTRKGTITVK